MNFVKIVQNQAWGGKKCLELKEVKVHVIEEGNWEFGFYKVFCMDAFYVF